MKSKLLLLCMTIIIATALAACDGEETKEKATDSKVENKQNSKDEDSKIPFPENTKPIGNATITVSTPAGNSKDGNVPVLFVNKDSLSESIGVDYENFQGDKETFVYINKKHHHTEQYASLTQSSEGLEGNFLKPGNYTIAAVQFEDNNPSKTPVTYTEAKYEIKKATE
ncbi:hypothetical protein [Bacillus testis]|uniref:hypothetical protein n=1 Tax=Bacillus testis TaxID=1622072 RepID=UPI00067F0E84|nr:hypothetical protein [Bacillus testis]